MLLNKMSNIRLKNLITPENTIDMKNILNNLIKSLIKDLYELNTFSKIPLSNNRKLMKNLYIIQIKVAKFLALYRCNFSSNWLINSKDLRHKFDINVQQVLNYIKKLKNNLYSNIPFEEFIYIKSPKILKWNFGPTNSFKELCIRLLTQSNPSRFTAVCMNKNSISISSSPYYSFSLNYFNNKLNLKNYKVLWPKLIKYPKNTTKLLSYLIFTSTDLFKDIDFFLYYIYILGQYGLIIEIIKNQQKNFSYKINVLDKKVLISFPNSLSPKNVFKIFPDSFGIHLVSIHPLYTPYSNEKPEIISFLINKNDDIIKILTYIRDCIYHTKLISIYEELSNSFLQKFSFSVSLKFNLNSISINTLSHEILRVSLDSITGYPYVNHSDSLCIEHTCGVCAPISRYIDSILGFKQVRSHQNKLIDITNGSLYKFSFSNDLILKFFENSQRKYFSLKSKDSLDLFVHDITDSFQLKNDLLHDSLQESLLYAKSQATLYQLFYTLKDKGIDAVQGSNFITFSVPPFDIIKFRITPKCVWSLKFWRPDIGIPVHSNSALKISGRFLSMRFVDWILYIVTGLETFLLMMRQAYSVSLMHPNVKHFIYYDKLCFAFRHDLPHQHTIYANFGPLEPYYRSRRSVTAYKADSFSVPHITCPFLRSIQLRRLNSSTSKNESPELNLSPFLCASLTPLSVIREIFRTKYWSISMLKEDGSFFIIYQNKYSLNVLLRPSSSFQMTVPLWGPSNVMMVPMMVFPLFCNTKRVSHPVMRLHISQLPMIKESIEEFFEDKNLLEEIGFSNYKVDDSSLIFNNFPKLPNWIKPNVSIKVNRIELSFNSPELNQLSKSFDFSRNFKRSLIKALFKIINFDENIVIGFAKSFTGLWENSLINWEKTFNSINLIENYIIMDLILSDLIYSYRIWNDNGIKVALSLNGFDVDGLSNISDLQLWLTENIHIV